MLIKRMGSLCNHINVHVCNVANSTGIPSHGCILTKKTDQQARILVSLDRTPAISRKYTIAQGWRMFCRSEGVRMTTIRTSRGMLPEEDLEFLTSENFGK